MPIQSAQEFLVHELHNIRDAETQASRALQQLEQSAENNQIRNLVGRRLKQGERLLGDVEKCLDKLDGGSRSAQNPAARGIIQECEKMLGEVKTPELKQSATIAGLQKLEHYCIASWGTVKALAGEAGEKELAKVMDRALKEGYEWDEKMTKLAESRVNPAALKSGEK